MLAVSDTGCGMDEETQSRIFEPFFTTKERGKGTGLGLSICKTLLREHNGNIEAATAQGGGAVFTITLPITSGLEPATPAN